MKTCVVLALFLMAGVSLADIQKRIIGGRRCTPQEEQHYVFLQTTNRTGTRFICSGSVIRRKRMSSWVLTAAHCDMGGPSFTVKSADRSVEQTVDRHQTYKHPTADVMLLKLKKLSIRKEVKKVFTRKKLSQPMTPIPLATDVECRTLRNHLNANNPVTFRITARDTQARAVYAHNRTGGNPDVTMCASITVDRMEPYNQTITNECCFGEPSAPAGCRTCGGDSGSGFIYNNALYAVFKGVKIWYIGTSVIDRENIAFTICDTDIRRWIDQTMRARP